MGWLKEVKIKQSEKERKEKNLENKGLIKMKVFR